MGDLSERMQGDAAGGAVLVSIPAALHNFTAAPEADPRGFRRSGWMSRPKRSRTQSEPTFAATCDAVEAALRGSFRSDVLEAAWKSGNFRKAFRSLRADLGHHSFQTASRKLVLRNQIRRLDNLTRDEGFEVFHTWDHSRHRFSEENAPVLTLDYWANLRATPRSDGIAFSILLDFYFLHVLMLLAVRVWDEDDPDRALDRVTSLLHLLQGPHGSRHRFAADGETLIMLAISQFHPYELAYDQLIEKIWTLSPEHVRRFALVSTAVLGAHLRWGLGAMYGRSTMRMRDDNRADYPWLLFALDTLLREYARLREEGIRGAERDEVVEGLLNGLTPDPWAFTGTLPEGLVDYPGKYARFCELLVRAGPALVEECKRHLPSAEPFSPMAVHFNFPHNVLMAHLMTALEDGAPRSLAVNAVLGGHHGDGDPGSSKNELAAELTTFAASPERLGSHRARLIIHDWRAGRAHCDAALRVIGNYVGKAENGPTE